MNGRISPLPLLANNNSKPTNPPSSSSSSSSSFLNPTNTQRPTNTSYIPGAASIPAPAPSSSTASPNPPSLRRVILHLLAAKPQTKEDLIKRARSILKAKVDVVDVEQILLSVGFFSL